MKFRGLFSHNQKETTRYLSSTQAAARMKLTPETVRRLCKDGVLPGAFQRKQGGPWYIPEDNIVSWLQNPSYLGNTIVSTRKQEKQSVLKNFGKLIGAIVALVTILSLISIVADYKNARQQLADWGIYIPIHPEREGEILIIVTKFEYSEGIANVQADREIFNAISNSAKSINLDPSEFRIELLPQIIDIDDVQSARKIAEKYNAHVVIWGADTGIRVTVNFLNQKGYAAWSAPILGYYVVNKDTEKIQTSSQTITINETNNSQIGNPKGYAHFITSDLPGQLSFLSFFVIGQSFYPKDFGKCSEYLENSFSYPISDNSAEGLVDEAYYWQGVCYVEGGDVPKGIISLKRSIEINPKNIFAHLRLSQSSWDIDQYDDAVENFSNLIDVIENTEESNPYRLLLGIAYQGRGLVRMEQVSREDGQFYREDKKFEDIKLNDPAYSFRQYAETYYKKYQTELLASVSDLEKARQSYETDYLSDNVLDLKEKIMILDIMSDKYGALMKLGKFQDAVDVVLLMDKITNIPINNYYKALAYEALGELPQALENYETYITREPAYSEKFIPSTIIYLKNEQ